MKKAAFKVRIDRMGAMRIACQAGPDVTETGVRGIDTFIHSGLMSAPAEVHFDPMHAYVELDGTRFASDADGARRLEAVLNERYAHELSEKPVAIKVRENPASPTGFEMEYMTERDGIRRDIIVRLEAQEIDLLQDASRCGLINPGVVLRLVPPYLTVRRRLPDGRETPIPGLADIGYRSATPSMIQHMLNHPEVLRSDADTLLPVMEQAPPRFSQIRLVKHPEDNTLLWLECASFNGGPPLSLALTHLNMANLQHDGAFLEHLDVNVSLDNTRLGILDRSTGVERSILLDPRSPEEHLQHAGRLLTASLRPVIAKPEAQAAPEPPTPMAEPAPQPKSPLPPKTEPSIPPPTCVVQAPPEPRSVPPELAALFTETDPVRINQSIFEELAADAGLPVMDVCFSLTRVFNQRRFRILNFEQTAVRDVMDLRGEEFYGVYLAELPHHGLDFVYACRGVHIEWGLDKCVLQPALQTEPVDFPGHGLLGLAQDADGAFLFIVEPEYKAWIRPYEAFCAAANAKFATLPELAAIWETCTLIWPPRPLEGSAV